LAASEWDRNYSYLFEIEKNKKPAGSPVPTPGKKMMVASGRHSSALYAVFHKDMDSSYLNGITPLYAGDVAEKMGHGYLTDRLVHSSSLLNSRWSELSAVFKIWKEGPRTDIIGFTHYRRFFNFNKMAGSDTLKIQSTLFKEQCLGDIYNHDYCEGLLHDGIAVANPCVLDQTIWYQYGDCHNSNDWCWVLSKLSRDYPFLLPYALEQFDSSSLFAYNMFITNWEKFEELCSLWFDILLEFEAQVPYGRSNSYQNRDIGFMAERIFDIWIRYKKSSGEEIRELPIFLVAFDGEPENIMPLPVGSGKGERVKRGTLCKAVFRTVFGAVRRIFSKSSSAP
jgi:hypothetical protein